MLGRTGSTGDAALTQQDIPFRTWRTITPQQWQRLSAQWTNNVVTAESLNHVHDYFHCIPSFRDPQRDLSR